MKRSEASVCTAVRAEETGLSMSAMPSEAGTGNEEWASDCSLWFTATFAFHPCCSLIPFISLTSSPLYFSSCILSSSLAVSVSRYKDVKVECWCGVVGRWPDGQSDWRSSDKRERWFWEKKKFILYLKLIFYCYPPSLQHLYLSLYAAALSGKKNKLIWTLTYSKCKCPRLHSTVLLE